MLSLKREKSHRRGLCQLKNSKLWKLTEGEDGKGEREEEGRVQGEGRMEERDRDRERANSSRKNPEAFSPKEIFFTEIRPFQTAPKVVVYIYCPLPKPQILHIFPGEESLWSPTWGRNKPGCELGLQSSPKKCFIFNLNVTVLYNLMP